MSKASVGLLLASLVVVPTSGHAGPETGGSVADSFVVAVNSLNKMRIFANSCGLSKSADTITETFVSLFSVQSGLSITEVGKIVQDAYASASDATGIPPSCDMRDVRFWAEAFHQRSREMDEVPARYRQHK
jgi:hypothetical protein